MMLLLLFNKYLKYVSNLIYSNGLISGSSDIKVHATSTSSSYYIISSSPASSFVKKICKYTFSPVSSNCRSIPSMFHYALGQLMLSDTSFFIIAYDRTNYDLHFIKFTFGNISVDWAKKIN